MKAVVTGGAGFIGSHLVNALISLGIETQVIDNLSSLDRNRKIINRVIHPIDVRDQAAQEFLIKEKPDLLFHFAAQANVDLSMRDPIYDASVNILGVLNMLQAARFADVKHFIFASSSAVYGESAVKSTESDFPSPVSYYGLSKLVSEMYIQKFQADFSIPFTIFRFGNVYGPYQSVQPGGAVITAFLNQIKNNRPLIIRGDGEQQRDFVYVKDVVQANILALKKGPTNEIYNVSTGTSVSINSIANTLRSLHKDHTTVNYEQAKMGDSRYSCLDNAKIKRALGWQPLYTLSAGLSETYTSIMDADD